MPYLSDLQGRTLIDKQSRPLGRVRDFVARVAGVEPAPIVGLLVWSQRQELFLPLGEGVTLSVQAVRLVTTAMQNALLPFTRRASEVLLGRDVMDSTVIDLRSPRVVRVNDVLLETAGPQWWVTDVDVGLPALLRRILPRAVPFRLSHRHVLPWADLELLSGEVPGGKLPPDHRRLARLHPADIARVADAVPPRLAAELVVSLDDALAADTMEEMIDTRQAHVVEVIDVNRAADILEQMAPDAAADMLAALEPDVVDQVLQRMDPAEAADVHALLTYPHNTAGGLMNPEYVLAPGTLRVADAVEYLRPQMEKSDWISSIYVVDDPRNRQLAGVVSLRDLFLAQPEQRLAEIARPAVRTVGPEEPAPKVAQIMSEYDLMALPVVDAEHRLLGIVSVDDALEIMLPAALRRHVPRVSG